MFFSSWSLATAWSAFALLTAFLASVKFYTIAAAACIDLEGQQATDPAVGYTSIVSARLLTAGKTVRRQKNRKIRVKKDKTILLREIANQNREIGRLGLFCYISGRSPDKSGDLAALILLSETT